MKKLFWWMVRRPAATPRLEVVGASAGWSGDGYSLLELERAGLTEQAARALGLPVDRERASALGSNVGFLEEVAKGEPPRYL